MANICVNLYQTSDHWFLRRCRQKIFKISKFNSGGHFVRRSGTIWTILVEAMMGSICGNYFKF